MSANLMRASFCRKEAGSNMIGVLALQGDFSSHRKQLKMLGLESREIRNPSELSGINGLIIPGGESTTILKFFEKAPWKREITKFSKNFPVFGTCAGTILLAEHVENPVQGSLGLVPVRVVRNGYGRQKDSFYTEIKTEYFKNEPIKCYFIRAPLIKEILHPDVEVIARYDNNPVLIRYKNILCSTFHSELSDDLKIHQLFAEMATCMNLA